MIKKIKRDEYFHQIAGLNPIPSKTLINKALPGIGGTRCEIDYNRHSIIIVPNIPVIIGKMNTHKTILGVYNAISNAQITDYFNNPKIIYKKFITTPESFARIIQIGRKLGHNIYNDYFLLFDECDRAIKDVGFRHKIIEPLMHLELFKNYAFISATALRPSNPILSKLKIITLVPEYSFTKDIDLICTNHPYEALKEIFSKTNKKVFVFCSSLRVIDKALLYLGEYTQSAIFCSEQRLGDMPDQLAYSDSIITNSNLQKYNFLTSRFFAAVDIDYDEDCEIVILSDVKHVSHSVVDPRTDVVQIIGRFRNKIIDKKVSIISNCNSKIDTMNVEEFNLYIKTSRMIYDRIKIDMETCQDKIIKRVFKEYLAVMPFNRFLNEDGTENHFLIDCYLYNEIVKSYYKTYDTLEDAYTNCMIPRSDMPYFNVNRIDKMYPISSDKLKTPDMIKTYRDKILHVSMLLDHMVNPEKQINEIPLKYLMLDKLKYHYPEIFEAFSLFGAEELNNYFSKTEVLDAINNHKKSCSMKDPLFRSVIYENFQEGDLLEGEEIRNRLASLFQKHGILHIYPTIKFLRNFFHIKDKGTKGKGTDRNKTFYKLEFKL